MRDDARMGILVKSAVVTSFAFLLAVGCKSKDEAVTTKAPVAAEEPKARRAEPEGHKPIEQRYGAIFQQLEAQKGARPKSGPTVEQVAAALTKAGIEIEAPRQGLAQSVGASYCAISRTKSGVGLSICEYTDAAAAKSGRARAEKQLAAFANHETAMNKGTILTLRAPANVETKDELTKMVGVFEGL